MADLGALAHNQLATLLNALASIDRRLSRIEAALKISNFSTFNSNNTINNSQNAPPGTAPSSPSAAVNAGVTAVQAGPVPLPVPQPPQHHQQQAAQQQQQQQQQTPVPALAPAANTTGILTSNPGLQVPASGNNALTPLEAPPAGYTISSRAAMQDELDRWTLPRGYSMRIAGAKVTGKRKVRWVCFRGGEARQRRGRGREEDEAAAAAAAKARAEGRRKPTTDRASKKCGCLFKFEAVETARDSDVWVLHYPNDAHKVHNHGPSDTASDPRARKLPPDVLAEVDQWLRDGWLVAKIQEALRARGFTNVLNTDLYNRKRLLKKASAQARLGS